MLIGPVAPVGQASWFSTDYRFHTLYPSFLQPLSKNHWTPLNVARKAAMFLAEKGARIMEDMQGKLKDFMNDYNKEKKYTLIFTTGTGLDYFLYKDSSLNITSEIVKGLNSKMK